VCFLSPPGWRSWQKFTGDRFGISSEVAVYCNAEQLRDAINAWQALIALELSIMSPP